MDDLIKLVRTYRFATTSTDRTRLTDRIFRIIGPDLHLFVFSKLTHHKAQEAFQDVLLAIARSLQNFRGDTPKEFWAWAYRIARNKLNDQYRKQANEKLLPVPPEDLLRMVEANTNEGDSTPAVKHDLEYAMKLLSNSKPECYDLLWNHYVFGHDYAEVAADRELTYDAARMKIGRCLEEAKKLFP